MSIRHPFGHRTDFARVAGNKLTMHNQDTSLDQFSLDTVDDYTEYVVGQQLRCAKTKNKTLTLY